MTPKANATERRNFSFYFLREGGLPHHAGQHGEAPGLAREKSRSEGVA